ncbi:DEAD/DEAH box helicase [Almyronema epifaneia]|uniref:DEAD/DEAH box helicase n=1 Tax=Almyronema epifaneia S1 TaxID=2991925 RepID=A0ABW6ICQ7_9CYAN
MLATEQLFPFQLDDFQQQAIAALNANKSVVVCAPTGSGKTLIGEYAIYRALAQGKRVFYTTPLKALSNQKLRDFRQQFGNERVGLLTGDLSINREAPVLVMTTEIFRNMLYGTPIGEVGISLQGVETVVLDECHYMNDRQRGTVWEESIIYCPPDVQLVALSATIANSDQLTDWINDVHGPTELIYSNFRPVPLEFQYCHPKGIFPLLNEAQTKLNPRLRQRRQPRAQKGQKNRKSRYHISPAFIVGQLAQKELLPAIYFIFSRRGCDKAVADMGQLSLVQAAEAALLKQKIDEFLAWNPEAARSGQVEPLYRGIAAHHAGILPTWKSFVEELFQAGLIKVVFATETLAAGINMPARTTVISSLSKRTDSGHRLLTASEFLQMAGRAGRRGMDIKGYVVTVETPFEGAQEAAYLATVGSDPLVSQFTPSYGMVLNLLQTHTLEEARKLIERSFGQYLATLHLIPQQQAIADLEAHIEHHQAQLAAFDPAVLEDYEKLRGRLKEERRLLKILQQQAEEALSGGAVMALPFALTGTLLSLKGKHVKVAQPLAAVLVSKLPGPGQFPYLVCLGQDNRWYVVTVADVIDLHEQLERLREAETLNPPPDLPLKPGQTRSGDETTARLVAKIPQLPDLEALAPEVQAQRSQVEAVEALLQQHPAQRWQNPTALLKRQKQLRRLESELSDRQATLSTLSHRYWQEFLNLMEILHYFDCLEGVKPTPLGEIAAAMRGDNELWLGLALASGEFDHLEAPQLAAACAALVTENSRPDSWTRYQLSTEVEDALGALRTLRRDIFKQQRRHQVALPVWLEYELTALVEQWANQTDWNELCDHTSLDEGDIVRVLRRTVDVLSQIPHVPHLSEELTGSARRAIALLDRFPINEGLG